MFDFYASQPHWAEHLQPVYDALPQGFRGAFVTKRRKKYTPTVIVASEQDRGHVERMGSYAIRLEHGVGFSFGGSTLSSVQQNPSYPGGHGQDNVGMFLSPNRWADRRWLGTYGSNIPHHIVGMPKMDTWHNAEPKKRGRTPVVCISFHWDCKLCAETRWAFPYYRVDVPDVAKRKDIKVVGHAHPRARKLLQPWFEQNGIEFVPTLNKVFERADLYCNDASSTMYEFASLGRPVVVMNSPWYRPDKRHGLRFWEHSAIGPQCWQGHGLNVAIDKALADDAPYPVNRQTATREIFPHRGTAAPEAARRIQEFARVRTSSPRV